jgi:hypothetical protein
MSLRCTSYKRRSGTRSGPVVSCSATADARMRETAVHGRLAVAPSEKLAGTSPEKAFSSYVAPFAMRIRPGGREERREAHQGLVDGCGVVKTMCGGEGRTGFWAHAKEGAPALGCCLWASGCFPRNTCASNEGRAQVKSGPTTTNCGGGIPTEEGRRGLVRWGEGALEQERARVSDVSGEEKGRERVRGPFTGDEELARPAMAQQQGTSQRRHVRKGGEMQ